MASTVSLARLLLVLFALPQIALSLQIIEQRRVFSNWTHVGDFVFAKHGRLEGSISTLQSSTSTSAAYLVLFEESLWLDLRMRKDPVISTCDLRSMASWSLQLDANAARGGSREVRVDFPVSEFGKYHVFIVVASSATRCKETMLLLREWRNSKKRGTMRVFHRLFSNTFHQWHNVIVQSDLPSSKIVSFNMHFRNPRFGKLHEFSADEVALLPTIACFTLAFGLVFRFQLASARLLASNTGIAIASALLVTFAAKLGSLVISIFGLVHLALYGNELHGAHDYKWGSIFLDGIFGLGVTLVLVFTAKGWMIATPSVSVTSDWQLMVAVVVHALANVLSVGKTIIYEEHSNGSDHYTTGVELLVGASHFFIFVSTYSGLVNLMRRSRRFVGARPRGRAFSAVAALVLTWSALPALQISASHMFQYWLEPFAVTFVTLATQLFIATVLAWTFRPEILWELHGERPHMGAAKLLYPSSSRTRGHESSQRTRRQHRRNSDLVVLDNEQGFDDDDDSHHELDGLLKL